MASIEQRFEDRGDSPMQTTLYVGTFDVEPLARIGVTSPHSSPLRGEFDPAQVAAIIAQLSAWLASRAAVAS